MLFANVCARFISSCYGELFGFGAFWAFLASLRCLVHMESAGIASSPVVQKTWVTSVCLLLDTLGGGITFVTSGENAWQLIKLPPSILVFMWDS